MEKNHCPVSKNFFRKNEQMRLFAAIICQQLVFYKKGSEKRLLKALKDNANIRLGII